MSRSKDNNKIKVVWLNFPAHGSTNPLLKTLKELIGRGLDITYYSSEDYRRVAEDTGAEFRSYNGDINSIKHDNQKDEISLLKFMVNITLDKLNSNIDDIRMLNPDIIIHDSVCPWGKYISRILNIPSINLMHTFPMSAGSMSGKLESWLIIPGALKYKIKSLFNKRSPLRQITSRYKQKVQFTDIMLNTEECNIIYSSSHMNPRLSSREKSYHFVGPSVLQSRSSIDFPFDKIKDRKVIYISLGTVTNNNIDFYKKCFKAFKDSSYIVVMSVGKEIDINQLGYIPGNFIVKTYVPQWDILGKAELFITNAGMNSVHESILNGVPLLALPDQIEKKLIAERVEKMNIGMVLNLKKVSPKQLLDKSEMIMSSNCIKENILKYKNFFRLEEKSSHINAADIIVKYINLNIEEADSLLE